MLEIPYYNVCAIVKDKTNCGCVSFSAWLDHLSRVQDASYSGGLSFKVRSVRMLPSEIFPSFSSSRQISG
jgi:hypothetical protein